MDKVNRREREVYHKIQFDQEKIIESFKLKELLEAVVEGKKLCHWKPFHVDDKYLLTRWKTWFRYKNVPWAVTEEIRGDSKTVWYLWKIDEQENSWKLKNRECRSEKVNFGVGNIV